MVKAGRGLVWRTESHPQAYRVAQAWVTSQRGCGQGWSRSGGTHRSATAQQCRRG